MLLQLIDISYKYIKIFGSVLIFGVENIFDFRGDPATRHQFKHGLVSTRTCCKPGCIYGCWRDLTAWPFVCLYSRMHHILAAGVIAVFGLVSVYGLAAIGALHSERLGKCRARPLTNRFPPLKLHYLTIAFNGTISLAYYFVFLYLFEDQIIHTGPVTLWAMPLQVAGCLLCYGLFYYLMHRWLHRPVMMRWIHGTHHKVRYPEALDGLYLSPVEMLAGLTLLFLSMYLFAPLGIVSFLAIVFVHAWVNIVARTSLVFSHPAFRWMNNWVIRHDRHHWKDLDRNFTSIAPVWDMQFGICK